MNDPADDLTAALDRIAWMLAGESRSERATIGTITLRPHQQSAAIRLEAVLDRHRAALLADAVGLGKTYVALAIARRHEHRLVVCPAALRSTWETAMRAASVPCPIVTYEALSRRAGQSIEPEFVIVDEAHHARTPTTARYGELARIVRHARVLFVSATPLHNSRRDLVSLFALVLGSSVRGWSDAELARLIVRRDERLADQPLPPIIGPVSLFPGEEADCLDAVARLPAAVPAADEGAAGALAALSLLHLWASSRAALVASVKRRRAKALALREAIASGHLPTSGELAAWHYADDALQLAFPFSVSSAERVDVSLVATRLDEYLDAVGRLIAVCRLDPDPDQARAELLRGIRARHPGARIVAFSQYAETVIALGRLLRADPGVAVLTARGARIASGLVTRREILEQFAGDARPTPVAGRVDLLLSTDLLSEGVDLRGASVIVHLDLPWNPARIEQRVGRARRLGSSHAAIHVYSLTPPASAGRVLDIERRLAHKARIAAVTIGALGHDTDGDAMQSPVKAGEHLRAVAASWSNPSVRRSDDVIIAAAEGSDEGWLALVSSDGLPRLIGGRDSRVLDDTTALLAMATAFGPAIESDAGRVGAARRCVDGWLAAEALRSSLGISDSHSPAKRAVLDRLAAVGTIVPRHQRASAMERARRARRAVTASAGVAAERTLDSLSRLDADDDAWTRSLDAFAAENQSERPPAPAQRLLALIVVTRRASPDAPPDDRSDTRRSPADSLR